MKPTLTANDELLLPNGKTYLFIYSGWATESIGTSIAKLSASLIGSLSNLRCSQTVRISQPCRLSLRGGNF
jgi:hypothetical protein